MTGERTDEYISKLRSWDSRNVNPDSKSEGRNPGDSVTRRVLEGDVSYGTFKTGENQGNRSEDSENIWFQMLKSALERNRFGRIQNHQNEIPSESSSSRREVDELSSESSDEEYIIESNTMGLRNNRGKVMKQRIRPRSLSPSKRKIDETSSESSDEEYITESNTMKLRNEREKLMKQRIRPRSLSPSKRTKGESYSNRGRTSEQEGSKWLTVPEDESRPQRSKSEETTNDRSSSTVKYRDSQLPEIRISHADNANDKKVLRVLKELHIDMGDQKPSEGDCQEAYEKLLGAWDAWKRDRKQDLRDQLGGGVKYGKFNPVAFFAHMVIHDKVTYTKEGATIDFTVKDLKNAMDPRFKEYGHQFLQRKWRDVEGSSWEGGWKRYGPGDDIAPGDQRRDGQHEWLPTGKTTKILHTILGSYSKQDQLAWISALDMLRTPTSDVPVGFAWNENINVKDVNRNPTNYTLDQIGIWEHHSGGLYSPEKQLNKGSGFFHEGINKLIDRYLHPKKSKLPQLLDALGKFIQENLWGGELPANLGLTKKAMREIPNTFTRQSQKIHKGDAHTYGRLHHTSEMMDIDVGSETDTVGTIRFENAKNFADIMKSARETKQRILETFKNRVDAIKSYSTLDVKNYLKSAEHGEDISELTGEAVLSLAMGLYDHAEDLGKKILGIQQKRWGSEHPYTIESRALLSSPYRIRGNYDEARPLLEQIVAINEKHRPGAKETGYSYYQLASCYGEMGRYKEAGEWAEKCCQVYEKASGVDYFRKMEAKYMLASSYYSLASSEGSNKKYDEAFEQLKEGLQIGKSQVDLRGGKVSRRDMGMAQDYHFLMASIYNDQGKYKLAEALLEFSYNPCNMNHVTRCFRELARSYMGQEKYEKAEGSIKKAINIYGRDIEGCRLDMIDGVQLLGQIYENWGKYDKAEECYQLAYKECKSAYKDHPIMEASLELLTSFYKDQKKPEQLQQLLRERQDLFGPDE